VLPSRQGRQGQQQLGLPADDCFLGEDWRVSVRVSAHLEKQRQKEKLCLLAAGGHAVCAKPAAWAVSLLKHAQRLERLPDVSGHKIACRAQSQILTMSVSVSAPTRASETVTLPTTGVVIAQMTVNVCEAETVSVTAAEPVAEGGLGQG